MGSARAAVGDRALAGTGLARARVLSLAVVRGGLFAGTDQHGVQTLRGPDGAWKATGTGLPGGALIFQLAVNDGALLLHSIPKGYSATTRPGGFGQPAIAGCLPETRPSPWE
jgi:hypothetical protein